MRPHPARLAILAALVVALTGCVGAKAPTWTFAPAAPSAAARSVTATPSPPIASIAPGGAIEIEAFDLGFKPATLKVPAAGTYDVTFKNTGSTTP